MQVDCETPLSQEIESNIKLLAQSTDVAHSSRLLAMSNSILSKAKQQDLSDGVAPFLTLDCGSTPFSVQYVTEEYPQRAAALLYLVRYFWRNGVQDVAEFLARQAFEQFHTSPLGSTLVEGRLLHAACLATPGEVLQQVVLPALRRAQDRRTHEAHATFVVALLRQCVGTGDMAKAERLLERMPFPDHRLVSNSMVARFLYYKGVVALTAADYAAAVTSLSAAISAAPSSSETVSGFQTTCHRALVLARLLHGEVTPHPELIKYPGPVPLLAVSQAYQSGSTGQVEQAVTRHSDAFAAFGLLPIAQRVPAACTRGAVVRLASVVKRATLAQVTARLGLDSEQAVLLAIGDATERGLVKAELTKDGVVEFGDASQPDKSCADELRELTARLDGIRARAVKSLRFDTEETSKKTALETLVHEEMAEDAVMGAAEGDE
ncbi:hypothetical protein KIPB_000930 [Kipferlia bialata]|uniref:26S proteasome non-ATPase regulatory subunit 3 N-terminal TPR repeats domain-containing protein n=1 Tax=Kipferlia bialata TaxID=797122 RepID=A0A9K3GEU2_9EUKA|nr:hypothetical protein KIPB_000930 [Kipferlia bialata]|eukprot:g930.t1